ncbi:hypothetical protein SELMODRAFT_119310 [Selaginella moellendorffii]|uniref:Amino acid permease/ SLC12A domain-containing protein n=2 Tax=Selaginella moellendorffii TaxID=88036 RepID=D8SL16_SELML|nr:hypothetical protein SELMODRAFT_119310 [Selaginella moellendorffii]
MDSSLERSGSARIVPVAEEEAIEIDADEKRLNELGYKQEYHRVISPLQQFAYTFTYTAPLGFVTGYYGYMYCYGGPVAIFWGMIVATLASLCIVLAIAEVYSIFPALGSVYYWVAQLMPDKKAHWLSWGVGWIYTLGAVCGTALNEYLLGKYVQSMVLLSTGGARKGGFTLSNYQASCQKPRVVLVTAGFFVIHLGVSVVSSKWLGYLSCVGAWFQLVSTLVVAVTLISITPKFQSFQFVFTKFVNAPGQGIHSKSMVVALGLPYLQAILTGFDVGSHIVEEVKTAAIAGPRAMVRSVYATAGVDLMLLLVMTFCIVNPDDLLSENTATGGGNASGGIQLFYDCFQARYSHGTLGAVIFTGLAAGSLFFANIINVTLTARCVYAMARDLGLPFHATLTKLTAREKIPVNATIATVIAAFAATLPSLGSEVAFTAIAAMSTVTAFIPYTIVLICKHLVRKRDLPPGPFSLRGWGAYLGGVGAMWGMAITLLFCLPPTLPIRLATFNYTALSLAGTLVAGIAYWIAHGRHTYAGPRRTI